MLKLARLFVVLTLSIADAPLAWAGKTRNVILVIADGVRLGEDFRAFKPSAAPSLLPVLRSP